MATEQYPDAIIVPAESMPGYLNREAAQGAWIGHLVGGRDAGGLVGALAGGIIGGVVGKDRMEQEYEHGRVVHKPASLNKSLGTGALFGGLMGGALAIVALIGSMIPLAIFVVTLGVALGALSGYSTHCEATRDYDAAKAYYDMHGGHYEGRAQEAMKDMSQVKAHHITPEEYALLQKRLVEKEKPHAHQVTSDPALAIPQR